MSSLTEAAEAKVFDKLCHLVASEHTKAVFAVGGIIPVTSLDSRLICESDGAASEAETNNEENPIDVDLISVADADAGPVPHKMRCDPVTIRWDSDTTTVSKVTLPCTDADRPNLEQLLQDCQPASFGRGGVDVLDETYRKAGKLDETTFSSNFNPYALGIMDAVTNALVPKSTLPTDECRGLRAELYKLNESHVHILLDGKFKAHVDTPRSKHQLGSLVVCLPTVHDGGQLLVRHHEQEQCFDWSGEKGSNAIQWAAFYSDCEHEVLEVTAGHRITLTYNLYTTCGYNRAPLDASHFELYQTVQTLLESAAFCRKGITLGYHCTHAYPHTVDQLIPTLPATFKGVDKVVYECLVATGLEVLVRQQIELSTYEPEAVVREMIGYGDYDSSDNENARTVPHDGEETKNARDFKKKFGHEFERRTTGRRGRRQWVRKDEYKRSGELSVLNSKVTALKHTDDGLYEGLSYREIAGLWDEDYDIESVRWLNDHNDRQLALVHGAYGNNPEIDYRYAGLVFTIKIPPFNMR